LLTDGLKVAYSLCAAFATCICLFVERLFPRRRKGRRDGLPYTFMQDMVAGTFRLPWEDQVKVTDGTPCGFPAPTRVFGAKSAKAAE
jgi:hypothetical protein